MKQLFYIATHSVCFYHQLYDIKVTSYDKKDQMISPFEGQTFPNQLLYAPLFHHLAYLKALLCIPIIAVRPIKNSNFMIAREYLCCMKHIEEEREHFIDIDITHT